MRFRDGHELHEDAVDDGDGLALCLAHFVQIVTHKSQDYYGHILNMYMSH